MTLPRRLSHLGHMFSESSEGDEEDLVTPVQLDTTSSDPGRLHLGAQTKSTYLSPSFFAAISQEISDIGDLLRQQKRYTLEKLPSSKHPVTFNSSTHQPGTGSPEAQRRLTGASRQLYGDIFPSVPRHPRNGNDVHLSPDNMSHVDIINALPAGDQCEALIWAYLKGYHTMRPLFNAIAFFTESRNLHLWRAGSNPNYVLGPHFVALYAAVIFAGCVVCPRATIRRYAGPMPRETLAQCLYEYAVCAIRLAEFPTSPSLWTFAAYVIVDSTWLKEEQPLSCSSFVGLAFRIAQMLGLHREPSRFDNVRAADIQVRRQLWWSIVALDAQVALASGLPPMIESELYHVRPIDEKDEIDVTSTHNNGLERGDQKTVLGIFLGGRFKFYRHTSDFLRIINNYSVTKADVDKVLKITHQIRDDMAERIAQITQKAHQWHELRNELASFAVAVLSMLVAKPYAIMYGPLRQHGLLPYLREKEPNAIGNCRNFLHQFLKIAQNQDFQPWHWCWPGQHQPLHSILALIMELEENPNDPLAPETRKLVDLGLLMCESSHNRGIVASEGDLLDSRPPGDGGSEAWDLIRKARDEAWERAGLDSTILRCPESAEEIMFDKTLQPAMTNAFEPGITLQAELSYSQQEADWTTITDFADIDWPQVLQGNMLFEELHPSIP